MLDTFVADWASPPKPSTSWMTDVTVVENLFEHRRQLVDRPFRSLAFNALALRNLDAAEMVLALRDAATGAFKIPLWNDWTVLTSPANAMSTSLQVETTTYRRFFAGQRVAVVSPVASSRNRWSVVYAVIATVSATAIGLTAALGAGASVGSRVYPAMDCDISLTGSTTVITDTVAKTKMLARETVGPTAIPALIGAGVNPSGETVFDGYPVMNFARDWTKEVQAGIIRSGSIAALGRSQIATIYGPRPQYSARATYMGIKRPDAWRILTFFDSRRGRTYPFWYTSPTADFHVKSVNTGYIVIDGATSVADVAKHTHIALCHRNGSIEIARITGAVTSGSDTRVNLASTPATPLQSIKRGSWAYFARFDTDAIDEEWTTDEVAKFDLPIVEIPGAPNTSQPAMPSIDSPLIGGDDLAPWSLSTQTCPDAGVTLPMYQDPCPTCQANGARRLAAAAPLIPPRTITLRFKPGYWERDTNFTSAVSATPILQRLVSPWRLNYDASFVDAHASSRHFLHSTRSGGTWTNTIASGAVGVTRRVWRQIGTYKVGATEFSIEVRLVAETPTGAAGSHGTVFVVYAFAPQLAPTFVDGSASGGINFWKDDPLVLSGGVLKAHPQMLLALHVATTADSQCNPCGSGGFTLYGGTNASANSPGNTSFALPAGGRSALVTLGGECDGSALLPYLVADTNGGATGLENMAVTFLRCTTAGTPQIGRAESVLSMNVPVELEACSPPQTGIDCCNDGPRCVSVAGCTTGSPLPNIPDCCFSRTSKIQLDITQTCHCYRQANH